MIINKFLDEIRIHESTSDFLAIQQGIVDMFKHNNPRNIVIKLFNNYKDFVELVKGKDEKEEVEVEKKKPEVKKPMPKDDELPPEETAPGRVVKSMVKEPVKKPKEKEDVKPNLEGAVAVLLKRTTGEDIELDLDRYYTVSGKKKSDILSDPKLQKTIQDIKDASLTDEKKLLMPLFQVNIKLDEYLTNKRHKLSIAEKQKIVLAVFWILLIDNKYIPSDEKLSDLYSKYGQSKNFKSVKSKINKAKKVAKEKEEKVDESKDSEDMIRFRHLMKTNVVNPNGIDIFDKVNNNNVDRNVLKKLEKEGFIENKKLGWYRITMDGKEELRRLQKVKPWRNTDA